MAFAAESSLCSGEEDGDQTANATCPGGVYRVGHGLHECWCAGSPLVTGKQWTDSSEQMKKAYLVGIANLVQVEIAYHADNTPADSQTIIPRLARGLKGQTLDTVIVGMRRILITYVDQPSKRSGFR